MYNVETVNILVDYAIDIVDSYTPLNVDGPQTKHIYYAVKSLRLDLENFPLTEPFPDDTISDRINILIEELGDLYD